MPTDVIQIPAGTTRYFDVVTSVSSVSTNSSISTQLEGDAAYPTNGISGVIPLPGYMAKAGTDGVNGDINNDFIWSPNAKTISLLNYIDWTNGYGLIGLPATNMSAEVVSY